MALSGSFTGSIMSGKYTLRVDWSATQNVAGNTSKITCTYYLVQASSWSLNISSRSDNTASIDNTSYGWSSPAIKNSGGKTTKLGTVTSGNITHKADGTRDVQLSATFNIRATISGTSYTSIRASKTVTLNTIPRATQPTLSASSVDMGGAVTISLPRASSSFTHDLSYRFNSGSWTSIATGVGTSRSWTVPDLASSIPNATSGTVDIRCITKNGSTTVGTKTVRMTAKVPTNVIPTVGTVSVSEATAGLAAQFGVYIQGKSSLRVNSAASGAKGSTIKEYSVSVAGKLYSGATATTSVINKRGTVAVAVRAKDSRGRWSATKTVNVTFQAYNPPTIKSMNAVRVDTSGALDDNGERLQLTYTYSVEPLGGGNTGTTKFEYKLTTASTWTTLSTGSGISATGAQLKPTTAFSTLSQYDIRLTVTDWFGASRSYTTTLPTGGAIIDIRADGTGIAFGKVSELPGIEFGWDVVTPGAPLMDLLWENTNVGAAFGAKSISVPNLSLYRYFVIVYFADFLDLSLKSTGPIPYAADAIVSLDCITVPSGTAPHVQKRVGSVMDNGYYIDFTNGKSCSVASSTFADSSSACVPFRVYGIERIE